MKKNIIIILFTLVPVLLMAQASGGQIRRSPQKQNVSNNKKQGTSQRKVTGTVKRKESFSSNFARDAIINRIIRNMVNIPSGSFTMGATNEQGSDAQNNEKPVHRVTLSSYSINKYEVTVEEWNAVLGIETQNHDDDKTPKCNISWNDCQIFIKKLNSLTGKNFRLPTEAEWEYAARGGKYSRNYKYSGSNNYSDVTSRGENVGSKNANELGLYDMSGNVWEWCQDIYGPYQSSAQISPTGALAGKERVIRGGGFNSHRLEYRVSYRRGVEPHIKFLTSGFRLAQ